MPELEHVADERGSHPLGVAIRAWCCPVDWHRYVKWDGDRAYCIEPGCWHSNVEQAESGR